MIKRMVSCSLFLAACSTVSTHSVSLGSSSAAPLESISVTRKGLFPEGIAYDAGSGHFLLGSFREGAVYQIDRDGSSRLLVSDERLTSVLGLCVDSKRSRLLVANADFGSATRPSASGPKKLASIGIYDLTTGAPLHFVNLGQLSAAPEHLANDLTIDAEGSAYVTDSFAPVIYKVDVQGNASIFLEADSFRGDGISLNGIVFHPGGFLIVAKKSDGTLFKVPLNDPQRYSRIRLGTQLIGVDGLVLAGNDSLVAICNKTAAVASNAVFALKSADEWQSAEVVDKLETGDVYPTTGTFKDDKLYLVHSALNTLLAAPRGKKGKLETTATIEQVGRR